MITRLFSKPSKSDEATVVPLVPDGQRVYCVGDIHGRADLLLQMHEKILFDTAGYPGKKTIVYLGDYVDRGEQSRQVIEILLSQPLPDIEAVYLLGNHEQAMLDFMEYPRAKINWLSFGGRETLYSYGIPLAYIPTTQEVSALTEQLDQILPDSHRSFLQNCSDSYSFGNYYFVHAGILPGVALDEQLLEDKLWIREEFLESERNHGAIIVHGHSIISQPELLLNRINIDTGAYYTGVLTCLVLEGGEQRLLQTGSNCHSGDRRTTHRGDH